MSAYSRAATIDFYFDEIKNGRMEISQLRKAVEDKGIDKGEIKVVYRQVDKQLLRNAEIDSIKINGKNLYFGGLILAAAGLLLTITSYLGIFDFGGYMIIAYGPLLGGLLLAFIGKNQMNRY